MSLVILAGVITIFVFPLLNALESMGGRGLCLVFGVVVLATVAIVTLIQRRLPAEQKTLPDVVMH